MQSDYEGNNIDSDNSSQTNSNDIANAEDSGEDNHLPGASDDSELKNDESDDDNNITWSELDPNAVYDPRLRVCAFPQPQLFTNFSNNATELDVF